MFATEERSEFLGVKEAADYLRVSSATIYRAITDGRLPVVRRGVIRVPRSSLEPKSEALRSVSVPAYYLPPRKPKAPAWAGELLPSGLGDDLIGLHGQRIRVQLAHGPPREMA
jgi:excisionase family DNA binding protein